MELALAALSADQRYKLLTGLVVPRPIAWITTVSDEGRVNAAPFSFFNVLGNAPPIVAFGPSARPDGTLKDTARNVEQSGEFVVNLVDQETALLMHGTAAPFPPDVSEVEVLGIATLPSVRVKPPRIAACKVHLECRHWGTVNVVDNRVVFGIIEHIHVLDGIVDEASFHVAPDGFLGIGRLQGPGWYATSAERFDLGRFPKVADVLAGKTPR